MRNIILVNLLLVIITFFFVSNASALPKGFVYLKDVDPTIIQDMRYATDNNFIGRPIKGYHAPQCILTREAARALSKLQQQLRQQSLGLKVFDCYRPETAVKDFVAWSQDFTDQKMKQDYYPNINKSDVFKLNYVAEKSGHSRGSTVDLTIVHLQLHSIKDPVEIEMGTHFDFLDKTSHPLAENVTRKAHYNRLLLQHLMQEHGFKPIDTEWWHFTLVDEPFPDTYFDFSVA